MDRLAFISSVFIAALIATSGGLTTASVAARKGHNPIWGAVAGALAAFAIGSLAGWLAINIGGAGVGLAVAASIGGSLLGLYALWNLLPNREPETDGLPLGQALRRNIVARNVRGSIMRGLFVASIAVALVALAVLLWSIINKSIGLTAVQFAVPPEEVLVNGEPSGRALEDLSEADLQSAIAENVRVALLRRYILEGILQAPQDDWANLSPQSVGEVMGRHPFPEALADTPLNKLDESQAASILAVNLSRRKMEDLLLQEVVQLEVVQGWPLWESLTNRSEIEANQQQDYPRARLEWRSWVSWKFVTNALDPRRPDETGLRPGIIGSLLIIAITILFAFPVGVGAAIFLEEYATDNFINRIIQTNISNLAGVPSIIYGILGLAIFVRQLGDLTSGQVFGANTANGRTVLSAGFTLALLILPLIIINAQEAIRAVPSSLRQASYGLGATKWQTIWNHVLPYAMPGILTGTILAISRAIGETAPLILVGGATYLTRDPGGPFDIFTALPLLIYRWTTLPQAEFRNAAAAAIVVLLLILLSLNSVAIVLRNRFSRRLS